MRLVCLLMTLGVGFVLSACGKGPEASGSGSTGYTALGEKVGKAMVAGNWDSIRPLIDPQYGETVEATKAEYETAVARSKQQVASFVVDSSSAYEETLEILQNGYDTVPAEFALKSAPPLDQVNAYVVVTLTKDDPQAIWPEIHNYLIVTGPESNPKIVGMRVP